VVPLELSAWDAWDGARRDGAADAERRSLLLADADAGKLAGREQGDQVPDAWCLRKFPAAEEEVPDAEAEPCIRDAALSAARSFAVQAAAADLL
jgi:hypothetical protein